MTRVLVFGSAGQVASALKRRFGGEFSVSYLDQDDADLADPEVCGKIVSESDADIIINAAAYTAVDKAEDEEDLATVINADAPGEMAKAAAGRGVPFLHISTDYVFDGSGDTPWTEDAAVAPLGAYGRSKLLGDQKVSAAGGKHVILRTAWVFSSDGNNFVRTMLRVGKDRDRLTVVDDQRGGPTAANDIADALISVSAAFAKGRGKSGIYHFCGAPTVSWCGFAGEIFRQARAEHGWDSVPDVVPIRTEDWPTPAERPKNSALDCSKIARDYGIVQPDWRASLSDVLKTLHSQTSQEPK